MRYVCLAHSHNFLTKLHTLSWRSMSAEDYPVFELLTMQRLHAGHFDLAWGGASAAAKCHLFNKQQEIEKDFRNLIMCNVQHMITLARAWPGKALFESQLPLPKSVRTGPKVPPPVHAARPFTSKALCQDTSMRYPPQSAQAQADIMWSRAHRQTLDSVCSWAIQKSHHHEICPADRASSRCPTFGHRPCHDAVLAGYHPLPPSCLGTAAVSLPQSKHIDSLPRGKCDRMEEGQRLLKPVKIYKSSMRDRNVCAQSNFHAETYTGLEIFEAAEARALRVLVSRSSSKSWVEH